MVPEPEPPSPPIVAKANLTLAKGWHNAITASINGGEPTRLSSTTTLELPAGEYTIRYSLALADYQTSRSIRANLAAGQKRTITNPILRPGRLSVQPSLGSPQGLVSIDGKPVGPRPVRDLLLAPGKHDLEVFAASEPTIALSGATVEIDSARETVITFDLTGQRELAVRYRDISP